jgi:His/Glu/Gln/Arg/opine family amino acid ABC transporter permease subunit
VTEIAGWIRTLGVGFEVTLELAGLTTLFAVLVATLIAVLALSPSKLSRIFAGMYVDVFRSIPILALLIFVYYGLGPLVNRLGISAFWLAVVSLTLIEAAYLAEIYRAALQSVEGEQWNAGASLGLNWSSTLRLIILPQAAASGLPGTVNMVIAIIKDSSLASLVAVNEITLAATQLVSMTFKPIPVYALLTLFYLALIVPFSFVTRLVERAFFKHIGLVGFTGADEPSNSLLGRMIRVMGGRWI